MNWRVVAMAPNQHSREIEVSLRLMGDRLLPAVVTEALHVGPSFAHAAGSVVEIKGKLVQRSIGVWGYKVATIGPASLEEQIEAAIRPAAEAHERFHSLMAEWDLSADLTCIWISTSGFGGPLLSPGLLARIAQLGLALNFVFLGLDEGRIEDYPDEARYVLAWKDAVGGPGGESACPQEPAEDGGDAGAGC